ncbi:hypothetical protein ACH5RR_028229 [Cinchona calisaya]|uniref:Uncharacterized protein n=1 Tax=Cinchona calisaya TaxID=153742 RepID=A0ABD2YN64_9GENT
MKTWFSCCPFLGSQRRKATDDQKGINSGRRDGNIVILAGAGGAVATTAAVVSIKEIQPVAPRENNKTITSASCRGAVGIGGGGAVVSVPAVVAMLKF